MPQPSIQTAETSHRRPRRRRPLLALREMVVAVVEAVMEVESLPTEVWQTATAPAAR